MRLVPISPWSFSVLLSSGALAMVIATGGCSDSDTPSVFVEGTPDSGEPPAAVETEAGSLFQDGGSFVRTSSAPDAAACTPGATVPGFTPAWKPPTSAHMCTAAQIAGYFGACLNSPVDPKVCTAYMTTNKACTTCLDTDETDKAYGPIIWHSSRSYFTFNIAGCVATEQKDVTESGCGAAYQASVTCKQAACDACLAAGNEYQKFQQCESAAGKGACKSYATSLGAKCGQLQGGDASTNACFPATATEASKDYFARLAPVLCGM